MDAALIIARLKTLVPELGGRVAGAAELAQLTGQGKFPQVTPAAHVVPTGIAGGAHLAQTGAYVQTVERLYSVVLTLRTGDPSGARAMQPLDTLVDAIIGALAGWDTGSRLGVLAFRRAQMLPSPPGVLAAEISFTLKDQLRISA